MQAVLGMFRFKDKQIIRIYHECEGRIEASEVSPLGITRLVE